MALRSLRSLVTCGFAMLVALLFAGAPAARAQSAARTIPAQSHPALPSLSPLASPPQLPTVAEMRAMTIEQLEQAGDLLREAKDYLSALDCYRAAIRKSATAQLYNKVAISELLLRHPGDAEKAARRAIRKDKHFAEAWNNLGVSYYMRRELEIAIRTYQHAISLNPTSASFHNNLAATLMDDKKYDLAMEEYRKAFQLDPTFYEHSSRNGISAHMGAPQDRAEFSFLMARLFAANGDYDRSLHFLRSAMEDGYPKIDEVYRDKEFAPVRKDERFLALMREHPVAIK